MVRVDKPTVTTPGGAETRLGTYALLLLFVTVFFSIFLQQVATGVGWAAGLVWAWRRAQDPAGAAAALPPAGLVGPLALFLAASGLSATLSASPATGWAIVGKELFASGIALAGASLVTTSQARRAIVVLLVAAAVSGAASVYQVLFVFDGVSDPNHRATGLWHLAAFVSYGNVLAMAFGLALGLAVWGTNRTRVLAAAAGGFTIVGMVLSYTRASWIATAGIAALVLLAKRAFVVLAAGAAVGTALLALPIDIAVLERARSIFDFGLFSNLDHLIRYHVGAAVVRDYPLAGTGPGVLEFVYPRYALPGAMDNWHLHNTYLQLLAERGPLGLATWLLLIGSAVTHALRSATSLDRDGRGLAIGIALFLVAMLAVAIFNYVWEDWRVRSLTLAALGLAWSPALRGEARAAEARAPEGARARRYA